MKNLLLILVFALFWGQSLQAQKALTASEDYNAALSQCGTLIYTGGGYNYTGTNITTTQVKNALGESVTSVGALCSSVNINKWAQFKPGRIDYSVLTDIWTYTKAVAPFKLGDFMGYNPDAKPPVHYVDIIPLSINVEQWGTYSFPVKLARGEGVGAGDKTKVDVRSILNPGIGQVVVNRRISIPEVSKSITQNIILPNITAGTYNLQIKPTYYMNVGSEFDDIAVIEDGYRMVQFNVVVPYFNGTIQDITDKTGGNPLSVSPLWNITRTSVTDKNVYGRIKVSGNGIATAEYPLNLLLFVGNETKTGRRMDVNITSTNNISTTVLIQLQVSNTYEFSDVFTVAESAFTWTTPGLIQ